MAHNTMDRMTVRIPASMLARADRLTTTDDYANRSEVVRDAMREFFDQYDFTTDPPRPKRRRDASGPQSSVFPVLGGQSE